MNPTFAQYAVGALNFVAFWWLTKQLLATQKQCVELSEELRELKEQSQHEFSQVGNLFLIQAAASERTGQRLDRLERRWLVLPGGKREWS